MKLALISDTHCRLSEIEVPLADVLIHAGDATARGTEAEVQQFAKEFSALPHPVKIFVPGNHDYLFEEDPAAARAMFSGVHVLMDELIQIDGRSFYGSPWTPRFFDWAFNADRGEVIRKYWDMIPSKIDVLITHGPPYGILDKTKRGPLVGCEELLKSLDRIQPKVHVFGHIHEAYGMLPLSKTVFVNACICDRSYKATNQAIVVDI